MTENATTDLILEKMEEGDVIITDPKKEVLVQEPTNEVSLTLESSFENELQAQTAELLAKQSCKEQLVESTLSPEEQAKVNDFVKKINIHDSAVVMNYGANTQKKMADFAESSLSTVKSKDLGEVGNLITGLVTDLKSFGEEEKKGIFGLFQRGKNKLEHLKAQHAKVDTNVGQVVKVLEGHQVQLLKDIAMFDKMYEQNLLYFKELTMYVAAGKQKLQQVRDTELKELVAKAQETGSAEDAQAARDLDAMCNRFEKKIHDLELTRTISMQSAPQIRMVQGNNTLMAEKITSTIVNTIPLWKSQILLALGNEHSLQAAQATGKVTDLTNELLKKNADTLKLTTVKVAKESERGVVDVDTLKHTNQSLISTLDEVLQIQKEGREKRREAEREMQLLENELKNKLLEINVSQVDAIDTTYSYPELEM